MGMAEWHCCSEGFPEGRVAEIAFSGSERKPHVASMRYHHQLMVPNACTEQRCGPLVAVGGAEDKIGLCVVLREFLTLAGGSEARILILPMASKHPEAA